MRAGPAEEMALGRRVEEHSSVDGMVLTCPDCPDMSCFNFLELVGTGARTSNMVYIPPQKQGVLHFHVSESEGIYQQDPTGTLRLSLIGVVVPKFPVAH